MSSIPHNVLICIAKQSFRRVKNLASSNKPGCKLARKHLLSASMIGLDDRPYLVADRSCIGWGFGPFVSLRIGCVPKIEPLF